MNAKIHHFSIRLHVLGRTMQAQLTSFTFMALYSRRLWHYPHVKFGENHVGDIAGPVRLSVPEVCQNFLQKFNSDTPKLVVTYVYFLQFVRFMRKKFSLKDPILEYKSTRNTMEASPSPRTSHNSRKICSSFKNGARASKKGVALILTMDFNSRTLKKSVTAA